MAELEAELCEAQIECRVPPSREDLELPEVERVRRDGIAIGFATMLAQPRRWADRGLLGLSMSAIGATALTVLAVYADPEADRTPGRSDRGRVGRATRPR